MKKPIFILICLLLVIGCKEKFIFKEYSPCEDEQVIHFRVYKEETNETLSSFSTNNFQIGMEEASLHRRFEIQFQTGIGIEYKCGGDYFKTEEKKKEEYDELEDYYLSLEYIWYKEKCIGIKLGEQIPISPNQEYYFITHNIISTKNVTKIKNKTTTITTTVDEVNEYFIPKIDLNGKYLYKEIPIKGCGKWNLRIGYNTYRWYDENKEEKLSLLELVNCNANFKLEVCLND